MKHIHVVAAICMKDKKIYATQRGYGTYKGKWEFPGGKVEKGESLENALIREIHEEMNADIKINKHFITVNYTYPEFALTMDCFLCEFTSKYELLEHLQGKWLDYHEYEEVDWLEADEVIIDKLKEVFK